MPSLPQEVVLLILIVCLLVLPRMLQRYRIPAPLASSLAGLTVDGMVVLFNGSAIVGQSNVDRVTIQ